MRSLRKFLSTDFFVLVPVTIFILLRFPSLFEPYWYGDEGIYQIIGVLLSKGKMLYSEAWDNKPPLLYIIYALSQGSQFVARLFSLIFGALTVVVFYHLATRLFTSRSVIAITSIIFAVIFGSPFLEGNIANAENFMLLPILTGMLITFDVLSKKKIKLLPNKFWALFAAGILFGLAFALKIVGIFEFLGVLSLIYLTQPSESKKLKMSFYLSLGLLVPMSIFTIYFFISGNISSFLESILFSNISYVDYQNRFIIPQGLLIFKTVILAGFLIFLSKNRHKLSFGLIFVLVWLTFSVYSSFFSQRSYTHYLLLTVPALILAGGYLFSVKRKNVLLVGLYVLLVVFLLNHFKPYKFTKSFAYYGNFIGYITGRVDTTAYQSFFDSDVPRDYAVAQYLKMKLKAGDPIVVWGNSAQIYKLSDTLPVGRYTVLYHVNSDAALKETVDAMNKKNPRFIIILKEGQEKDLPLTNYAYLLTIEGAAIYEKKN